MVQWSQGSSVVASAAWDANVAQVRSLALEPPHAVGTAKKKKKTLTFLFVIIALSLI